MEKMPVITGDLQTPYEILDSVSAMHSGNPDEAFKATKEILARAAAAIGADAVIHCQFTPLRVHAAETTWVLGKSGKVILFGAGTAIKKKAQ